MNALPLLHAAELKASRADAYLARASVLASDDPFRGHLMYEAADLHSRAADICESWARDLRGRAASTRRALGEEQ